MAIGSFKPEPYKIKYIDDRFVRYIERNRQVAFDRYGDRLDENRRVKGTDIWFDYAWRFHQGVNEKGQ